MATDKQRIGRYRSERTIEMNEMMKNAAMNLVKTAEECARTDGNETNLTPEQKQWLATASGDTLLDSLLNMQFHNRFGCNNEAIANVRREILRRMGESK